MHQPEDSTGVGNRWTQWRESIIGLGEQSSRKSYYPELQRRLAELKDSEEKLRAVFNSTHDAIFIHRYDGTIDEVNDPMLALFGVPRERALQFTVADYTSAEAGRERLPLLYRMESIGRLAGGVAHDFNNMLTPILSYAVMLRDDLPGDDERRVDLGEIVRSAERARDLVRQLLAFARRQTFELRPLDLNGTIRGFERMLRRVLREDIALRLELAPQPATIAADVGQIEQVLMNLVVNAQDAMPQGGTLVLATAALPPGGADPGLPDGPLVRMCVKDTGTGMDAATVARIFEPFFTTKEQGKGTGLGLASVYGIVQQHGGQILVHSQPGQGSTFSLYFPRLDASQCAGAAPEPPVVAGQTGAGTILVAEDQEQVRFLVAKVLGRAGYRVLVAASGDEALRLAEAQHTPIDLLVSDVVMPGLNGRELYGRLQERWPGIRALFVSGYAAEVVATGLDLLPKPFTPDVLLSRVRHALLS